MWALGSDGPGCNAMGYVHGSTYSVTSYLVPSPRSSFMPFFPTYYLISPYYYMAELEIIYSSC